MKRLFVFLVILGLNQCGFLFANEEGPLPQKWSIHGVVRDKQNGEILPGTTIYVPELKIGTVTDAYGNYSLTLPEGTFTVVFSFIGFDPVSQTVTVTGHLKLDLELQSSGKNLNEVVVLSEKGNKNIVKPEMSTVRMDMKTIQKIPALMGEVDVIKAVQLLPGVQAVSDGSNQFSVRGGAPDQNLISLDEATVYNPSHMLGFFSVFNNDAIRDAKLYKGDIPSNYGGRLSSVLDVRMKEGNAKKFEVTGGLGLIASRLTVEGPILKDRMSFMISGRRTYLDLFTPLSSQSDIRDNRLYFYDFNAKLNFRLNDKNQLFVSGYFGRDVFKDSYQHIQAGNGTGTLRWNHVFSNKLFGTFTAVYSDYRYYNSRPEGSSISYEWKAALRDIGAKGDFRYCLNPQNTLTGGFSATWHRIQPGFARGLGEESIFGKIELPVSNSVESGIYLGNEQKAGEHWVFKYGLRLSCFQNIGPATVYHYNADYIAVDSTVYGTGAIYNTYTGLEPRLGILYTIDSRSSVKASYSRTKQYLQLAQNSATGTPFDVWFPASPNIKPQVADQVAAGYFRNFLNNTIETSAELYYKKMDNVIDFCDFADLMLNPKLEGEVRQGKGWSYGLELFTRVNTKKVSGWVSYTYSRSMRQIPGINNGLEYRAPYDRPHSVSVVINYQFAKRWGVSANWIYSTGNPATFPTGRAEIGGKIMPVYSDRNACRYPDYHRLDLSVTFSAKEKPSRKFFWDLNLSVYNVYDRKNAWAINFVQDKENPNVTYAEKVYLFGIVPSLTFNFHF